MNGFLRDRPEATSEILFAVGVWSSELFSHVVGVVQCGIGLSWPG